MEVMKDAGLVISRDLKEPMQSLPPTSFSSPSGLPPPALPPQHSTPSHGGGTIHYGVEAMFSRSSSTAATSSSHFSRVNSITPSPMMGSPLTPHQSPSLPLAPPPQSAPSVLSYRHPGILPPTQHPAFTPPSSYPTYPGGLPIHHDQAMNKRFLFPGGSHPMSRFPGFTGRGPNPAMVGYGGPSENGELRIPYTSSLLPSERKMAGVPPIGCARNSNDGEPREVQNSRKKRKACGHCPPCQRKENCGTCQNCINRTKGKQICIHRKCDVLKKKPGSATYLSSPTEPKLEKRKEIDDFLSSSAKRSKISDNPAPDLPQSLIHPTLHPDFPEFGDVRQSPLQDLPTNRRSLVGCVTSSLKPSANENPSFFNSNEETRHYNQSVVRPVDQKLSAATGGESDFINQALQVIEGNITTTPSQPNPASALNDAARAGLDSSSSNQDNPHLQHLPSHRRNSQAEASFSWNSDSVTPIKLPGQPPPIALPPGPGPGSDDQSLIGTAQLRDLQKYGSSPSLQADLHSLKETPKSVGSTSARRRSNHDTGLNLQDIENMKTSQPHVMPSQRSRSNFQAVNVTPGKEQGGFETLLHQPVHTYPQFPGAAVMANQLATNVGQSDIFLPAPSAIVQPHSQVGQPSPIAYTVNQRFSYNDPSKVLNKPMAPSNDVFPPQQPTGQMPGAGLPRSLVNPAQYPHNMQYHQNGALGGQPTVSYTPSIPQFGSMTGYAFGQSKPPGPAAGGNPLVGNHDNGQQWNYENQPHVLQNMGADPNTGTGPMDSPTNSVFPSGMPRPSSFPHRRISNTSAESFHNQRHLSAGSCGNNQSPMMQSSPASGPSMLTHSPFPSGNSVRSPMSSLVSGSPAPQVQGVVSSPMPHVCPYSMHNTNAIGTLSTLPAPSEPTHQRNMQTYQPCHDQQDPNGGTTPGIHYHARLAHSVAPSDGYAQKPAVPVNHVPANHFLAKPGSSFGIPETQKPYNGTVASSSGDGDRCDANDSVSAARLLRPAEDRAKDTDIGLQTNTSAQRTFTETMNSVLYGHTPSGHPAENISVPHSAESPTDAHSTISPGESGYDSMDHVSLPGDNVNTAAKRPKNLQAALMGNNNESAKDPDRRQSSGVDPLLLPGDADLRRSTVKAALPQAENLKEKNEAPRPRLRSTLSNRSDSLYSSAETHGATSLSRFAPLKPRSASLDSRRFDDENVEMDFLTPEKPKLSLRRFSCQGLGNAEELSCGRTVFEPPIKLSCPPTPTSEPGLLLRNCKPNDITKPVKETDNYCKSSELLLQKQVPGHPLPPGFDTPPQTPNVFCVDPFVGKPIDPKGSGPPHEPPNQGLPLTEAELTTDDLRGRAVNVKGSSGTIVKRTVFPQCNCLKGVIPGDEAPYYTHLGCARDPKGVRKLFEKRIGFTGEALRIEKVCYTGKEGRTSHGCPVAKWILRRSSVEEKAMIVCRQRPGHHCATACVVLIIMLWEGMPTNVANFTYAKCAEIIPTNGVATERRCGTNEERTCACQGFDPETGGASFSFGCSWSMYYNGCKFARSTNPNKFKLTGNKDQEAESFLDEFCQTLATLVSQLYKKAAPEAYKNQTEHEEDGTECRLGRKKDGVGRPFSGVTCCMDFCAHSHKDQHNMDNGTTIVVTLTKPENRAVGVKPADEQLHVLPLYRWDPCGEEDTVQGIGEKLKSGAVEILSGYRREVRLRDEPLGTCKQRKEKRKKDANSYISPAKKKGKKPKRSESMEDLSMTEIPKKEGSFPISSTGPSGEIPQWSGTPHLAQHNPLTSPPPRWPYRRHPATSQDHGSDNLPSIGSIFSPLSSSPGLTPPTTPNQTSHVPLFQFGRRLSTASPAQQYLTQQGTYSHLTSSSIGSRACNDRGHNQQETPLPSLNTVISHPFHKDFASVKPEPNQDQSSSFPQNQGKINLKSYAAPGVKQEPPGTSNLTFAAHPQPPLHPGSESAGREVFSDSEECFRNPNVGGVAIATGHGSILIECAKRELHATTSLLKPDRFHPSRISLVFYQHKNMNFRHHGAGEYLVKEAKRSQEKAAKREREEIEKLEMKDQRELEARCGPYIGGPTMAQSSPQIPYYPVPHTGFSLPKNADEMKFLLPEHYLGSFNNPKPPHIPVFQPKRFPFTQPATCCSLPNESKLLEIPGNPVIHTAPFQSSSVWQPLSRSEYPTSTIVSSQPGSVVSDPTFQASFSPNLVSSSCLNQCFSRYPVASAHKLYYSPQHTVCPGGMNPHRPPPRTPSNSLGCHANLHYSNFPMSTPAYSIRNYGVGTSQPASTIPIHNPRHPISPLRYAS